MSISGTNELEDSIANAGNLLLSQIILRSKNQELLLEENEPIKSQPNSSFSESFKILGNYRRGNGMSKSILISDESRKGADGNRKLSTEDIIRLSGERYIHFIEKSLDGITTFIYPYCSSLTDLSKEEVTGMDLVQLLLASAEKVSNKQFESAGKLLDSCECKASESGNPVQRLVYYFSNAIRKRIVTETGRNSNKVEHEQLRYKNGLSAGVDVTMLAIRQMIPFCTVMEFAAMQAILENVAEAKIIHLIDLQLRDGIQWTPLLQALSERKTIPVELVKITVFETSDEEKAKEVGKKLQSYAKSMNIPLAFKVVFVSNIEDLKEESFNIEPGEAVALYSPNVLRAMIQKPQTLETLLRVIQRLRPTIMIVSEIEASHNSPSFPIRFVEALFFFSAWFDSLDECIDRVNNYRMDIERHLGQGIHNIVATEGEERIARSVKIDVWRGFFARFQMEEVEISNASLEQANLVLEKRFSCGSSCSIDRYKKCLIVKWKGTPVHSVSAWKFRCDNVFDPFDGPLRKTVDVS